MNLAIYDPRPCPNEYLSLIFFEGLLGYAKQNRIHIERLSALDRARNCTVLCITDLLDAAAISMLKNNGCKIAGFSVTDSSYVSQCCRDGTTMGQIDLIFALTGIQKVNEGHEFVVDQDFNVSLERRQFLPEGDWEVFDGMRKSGRLQSLPYVSWVRLPEQPARPYSQRSQKVIMRGGLHARRFILALFLMRQDLLDVNSGFVTSPYFADSMVPQFRYCDDCREIFKTNGHRFPLKAHVDPSQCNSSAKWGNHKDWCLDLGQWNNRCPNSFFWLAMQFRNKHGGYCDNPMLEKLVNAQWLTAEAHQELLGRITFTSDLKWLFSIYAAQRFWDAAAAGCVNVLPSRSADQEYFPKMEPGTHYKIFNEDMGQTLAGSFLIDEEDYKLTTQSARALYDQWIVPDRFALNENLCRHIISKIEEHCA